MAAPKKKAKVSSSDVAVGNRSLDAVLLDLAERSARAEERSARAEERSARAEEQAAVALQTIAAVTQDLRAFTAEMRVLNERVDRRLAVLERAPNP